MGLPEHTFSSSPSTIHGTLITSDSNSAAQTPLLIISPSSAQISFVTAKAKTHQTSVLDSEPSALVLEEELDSTVPSPALGRHMGLKVEPSPTDRSDGSGHWHQPEVCGATSVMETTPLLHNMKGSDGLKNQKILTGKNGCKTKIGDEEQGNVQFLGGITRKQFWLLFTSILLAAFLAGFDCTMMASTHTSVTSSFKTSNNASWLSTSFLLTSTSIPPLFARVSDKIGRKIPYIFGIFLFTVATIWCALANNIGSFIAARALCGIGCGGMMTMGAIILSDVIPITIRGNYQSFNNLSWGTGSMMGAALGGLMADAIGWRWEFGIQVPLGILCMILAYFTMGEQSQKKLSNSLRKKPFDYAGSMLLTTSTALLILSLNTGGNIYPWLSAPVLIPLAISLVLLPIFFKMESKASAPILPLEMFWTSSPHRELTFSNFFGAMTINSVIFNLPLYFQAVLLETATIAGSRLLLPSLASTIGSVAAGLIITRTGNLKPTLLLGAFFVFLGPTLLIFLQRGFSNLLFFVFILPTSLGIGLNFPSVSMSLFAVSLQPEQAVAASTLFMLRTLGAVLGVSSSSMIVQNLLVYYLGLYFPEEGKRGLVERVRRSVQVVFELEGEDREKVVRAYEGTLWWCFVWAAVTGGLVWWLSWGVRLPRLEGVEEYREERRWERKEGRRGVGESGDDDEEEEGEGHDEEGK